MPRRFTPPRFPGADLESRMRLYLDGLSRPGRKLPRPRRRKGGEPEREPVEPDKPRPLSGGAAAELEYDE